MVKPFNIPKELVIQAYEKVKKNAGGPGIDQETLSKFDQNLKGNLYKIWNRMSSGAYFPPPVKAVPIPKKSGGQRILGVPTVADRIAQMVVKLILEPKLEPLLHEDSYGYREGKSGLDAIEVTRKRCWATNWVIEFDIKGLFDNVDHELLMKAVRKHTYIKWLLLYIERWLTAPMQLTDGTLQVRTKGVPQGGVVSPLLSNLFMHYTFDHWISKYFPGIKWCRYADDGLVHCNSEQQAKQILAALDERFKECNLELHPNKTKIIYCKDVQRKGKYPNISFDFLGYTFKPRRTKGKNNVIFTGFNPAVSRSAQISMRMKSKSMNYGRKTHVELEDIAKEFNPVLRGWYNYYGKFYRSALKVVFNHFNDILMRWAKRKYKSRIRSKTQARELIAKIASNDPTLFYHWQFR